MRGTAARRERNRGVGRGSETKARQANGQGLNTPAEGMERGDTGQKASGRTETAGKG